MMSKFAVPALTLIILALTAALVYFIFQNQKLLKSLAPATPSPSQETRQESPQSPSPTPISTPALTTSQLEENIKDALNSKNFAALSSYMTTPTVNFIIMSSECCQPQTPQEAIDQLAYIEQGIPMDFNQQNPTIENLKAKNSRLTNAFVGISQSQEHLVAFDISPQNKISGIEVAVSWKLYNLQ